MAHEALIKAAQAAKEIGSRRTLWKIYSYLGVYERQQGNEDEALRYSHQAQEIIAYIVDRIDNPEMKNLFLTRAEIKNLKKYIDLHMLKE